MFCATRSFSRCRRCAMSSFVQAGGTSPQAAASEKGSSWNKSSDALAEIGVMTMKFGADALEVAGVSPGDKLLDVASGPGHLAFYAAAEKGATVDAIDFAADNIAKLKSSLESQHLSVAGHVMDGQQLEFPDGHFDITSSCFGVFLFPEYMKGIEEMYRVTRPGGKVAVIAWAEAERSMMRPCMQLLQAHFPDVLPLPMPPGAIKMSTCDGMKEVLEAGGYQDVLVSEVVHTVTLSDPEAYAQQHLDNPIIGVGLKKLGPERVAEFVPKFTELLRSEYMQGDTVAIDAFAVIGCGTKPSP